MLLRHTFLYTSSRIFYGGSLQKGLVHGVMGIVGRKNNDVRLPRMQRQPTRAGSILCAGAALPTGAGRWVRRGAE
jgi:hypothetical protein